jgi:hypothetical protein
MFSFGFHRRLIAGFLFLAILSAIEARAQGMAGFDPYVAPGDLWTNYTTAMGGPNNVRTFGAKGDCVTDDESAIQLALDTPTSSVNGNRVATYVPSSLHCYLLGKPIVVTHGGEFSGDDEQTSVLNTSYYGPSVLLGTPGVTLDTSLISGPGNSFDMASTSTVELSSYLRNHLNGHTAFSIEFLWAVPSGLNGNTPNALFQSDVTEPYEAEFHVNYGPATFWGDPGAFQFYYDNANHRFGMGATILEGSTPTWVQTYSANNTDGAGNHLFGLYFDGSHLWNCFDGTASTPVAASGTWLQSEYEAIFLPSQHNGVEWYPDNGPGAYSFPGKMDNLRFSNIARATSGHCPTTPTVKYIYDSNTDFLMTFNSCGDGSHYCLENTPGGYALWAQGNQAGLLSTLTPHEIWIPVLGSTSPTQYMNINMHDMTVCYSRDCQGLVAIWTPYSQYERLTSVGEGHGFNFYNNDYVTTFKDLTAYNETCCGGIPSGYPGYRATGVGFEFSGATNNIHGWNLKALGDGWTECFAMLGTQQPGPIMHGGDCVWGAPSTAIGRIFKETSGTWDEFLDDQETIPSQILTSIYFNPAADAGPMNFVGNALTTYNGSPYVMYHAVGNEGGYGSVTGGNPVHFEGTSFGSFGENMDAKDVIDFPGVSYSGVTGQIWEGVNNATTPLYKISDSPTPGSGAYAKWDLPAIPAGFSYSDLEYINVIAAGCTETGTRATCPLVSGFTPPTWWTAGHKLSIFEATPGGGCTTPSDYAHYVSLVSFTSSSITFDGYPTALPGSLPTDTCEHTIIDLHAAQDMLRAPNPITGNQESSFYDVSLTFDPEGSVDESYALLTGNIFLTKGVNRETLNSDCYEMSIPGAGSFDRFDCGAVLGGTTNHVLNITASAAGSYSFTLSLGNVFGMKLVSARNNTWPRDIVSIKDSQVTSVDPIPLSNEPGNLHVYAENGMDGQSATDPVQPHTIFGTSAGQVEWTENPWSGPRKEIDLTFIGYENTTGTAQTIGPIPGPFALPADAAVLGTGCTGVTFDGSIITLPSSMITGQGGGCKISGM